LTGLIIKSVCYGSCRLDIESLFIKEEYRKKGIGKALIKFMEKEAREKNILHFHINTNMKNKTARLFYEKLGYKDTGEILLDKTVDK
jgi:GNAT superfamily N-acetyltransferase